MQPLMQQFVMMVRAANLQIGTQAADLAGPIAADQYRQEHAAILDPAIEHDPVEVLFALRNNAERYLRLARSPDVAEEDRTFLACLDTIQADDGSPEALDRFQRAADRWTLSMAVTGLRRAKQQCLVLPDRRPHPSRGMDNSLMSDVLEGFRASLLATDAALQEIQGASRILTEPDPQVESRHGVELLAWARERLLATGLPSVPSPARDGALSVIDAVAEDDGSEEAWSRFVRAMRRQILIVAEEQHALALSRCG